jgi:NhaP-type Na+/H+ or K+/H+ antiporter
LTVEWAVPTVALALLGFAAISGRIAGTSITPAIVFTAVGMVVGVDALGLVEPSATGESLKLLAEATLTVVLFSDAARIDFGALRREVGFPARLLGIGLPLTVLAGFVVALVDLGGLAWPEALVLAVILAPTDAALGQAVVTLKRLPSRVRQSLNVESGLNDGICVPLFFIVLAVAQAEEGAIGGGHALELVAEKIGYGIVGGIVAGGAAALVLVRAHRRWPLDPVWFQVVPLAGAAFAFGLAEAVEGSGFIAAFVGGAVFGGIVRSQRAESASYLIEQTGAVLGAVTFLVFGAVLLTPALGDVGWEILLYAVLSLTLIRMLPVAIALVGTGARRPTTAFVGWFGPRGLASIVFTLLLLEEGGLPNDDVIVTTAFVTIGLSILAHGVTAAPFSRRYADWVEAHPLPGEATLESVGEPVSQRWRLEEAEGVEQVPAPARPPN